MNTDQNVYHQEDYRGYTIKIAQDLDPIHPRSSSYGDRTGTIYSWAKPNSNFGRVNEAPDDVKNDKHGNLRGPDSFEKMADRKGWAWLRVYGYSHSGERVSTSPFSCPWDSGHLGYIYATKEDMKEWGVDKAAALKQLQSAIEEWDCYLRGDVYGYVIVDPDGDTVESCRGYYNMPDDAGSVLRPRESDVTNLLLEMEVYHIIDHILESGHDGKRPVLPGLEKVVVATRKPKELARA